MDPDAALAALREQASDLTADGDYADAMDVQAFVEQFEALDEWLSKGGFPPEAWTTDREDLIQAVAKTLNEELPEIIDALRRRGERIAEIAVDTVQRRMQGSE